MQIESSQQAKNTLRTLTESLWVMSALSVLTETGALSALCEDVSYDELELITKLPKTILIKAVALLIEAGILISIKEYVRLAPGMKELVIDIGPERVSSQLTIALGASSSFVKSAREKKLQPGWHHTDEWLLQAQGSHSEYVVTDCIPQDVDIHRLLQQPGAKFLDIGAGVGKISLRACQIYPDMTVVALEPADAPYSLARQNIDKSKYSHRIDLRKIHLENILDKNEYDVAWFPHVFFSDDIFDLCLEKIWHALKPGGSIISSAIFPDKNNVSTCMRQLLNALYGGLRTANELKQSLENIGFQNINIYSEIAGYRTITATKPYSF